MRKIKKRKTKLIHEIRQTWKNTDKGKNIHTKEEWEIILAICGTLFYLELFDALKKDRQKEYFIKSHLSTFNNMSNVQLSQMYKICADTISDYCSMHIEVYEECLRISKEITCLFDSEDKKFLMEILVFMVQNRKK